MLKILINVSDEIEKKYQESLEEVINATKKNKKLSKDIDFHIRSYKFSHLEELQIKNSPNEFLKTSRHQLYGEEFNSIIYISKQTVNLKGNFIWYSVGGPKGSIMVFSSFIYKHLIERKINFGAYILLIYSQYLARFAVNIEETHRMSRNCLNDFCANQIEILNAFKNEKDVLCNECVNNIEDEGYYNIIRKILHHIDEKYHGKGKIKVQKKVKITKPTKKDLRIKSKTELKPEPSREIWHEFEIYVAKKCANISELYEKLDQILSNPDSTIDGYSIYEVGGGWRGDINLPESENEKWEKLKSIKSEFEKKEIKDIIRPLIDKEGNKYAVYDETSIVLRIIAKEKINAKEKTKAPIFDEASSEVFREIKSIFEKIIEKENSVFFTVKILEHAGKIKKID